MVWYYGNNATAEKARQAAKQKRRREKAATLDAASQVPKQSAKVMERSLQPQSRNPTAASSVAAVGEPQSRNPTAAGSAAAAVEGNPTGGEHAWDWIVAGGAEAAQLVKEELQSQWDLVEGQKARLARQATVIAGFKNRERRRLESYDEDVERGAVVKVLQRLEEKKDAKVEREKLPSSSRKRRRE